MRKYLKLSSVKSEKLNKEKVEIKIEKLLPKQSKRFQTKYRFPLYKTVLSFSRFLFPSCSFFCKFKKKVEIPHEECFYRKIGVCRS